MSDLFLADLWCGVRGDMPLAEFERWLYDNANELESRLGQRTALEVLAADGRCPSTGRSLTWRARGQVSAHLN